jgi:protein-disulfide isomerase
MRSRWVPLTLLTLGAIGLIAGLVSISVGENRAGPIEAEGAGEVQQLIGGIRQLDDRLGDDDSPVEITVFNDVQCPRCADYQAEVIDPLIADYARTGKAKLVFRNFPLGPKPVTLGAIATEAASEQDRGWQYAWLFLRNLDLVPNRVVDQDYLNAVAAATPKLDTAAWEEAVAGEAARQAAEEDVELATELRLPADPALVIEGASGVETLERAPSLAAVEAAIDRVR